MVIGYQLFKWCGNDLFFPGFPVQLRFCGVAFLLHRFLIHWKVPESKQQQQDFCTFLEQFEQTKVLRFESQLEKLNRSFSVCLQFTFKTEQFLNKFCN